MKTCKTFLLILFSLIMCGLAFTCANQIENKKQNVNYVSNRAPLQINTFIELPLGSISAHGWLKEMLHSQRDGATGHLDEIYPHVMGTRNGWLGGDGDCWERGPYWIDGLLPLGYILKDSFLIAKAKPWIEWTLQSQQENGQFGPNTDYDFEPGLQRDASQDWWPRMVVLKVLAQYYSATKDNRVIDFMTRYFHYQLSKIEKYPLDNWSFWARYRGGDNMMTAYWLYNITGDVTLLKLCEILYRQTEQYTDMFLEGDKLSRIGTIHAVNLAQGMKTPIVYWQANPQNKHLDALNRAMSDLKRFHGYPIGMFSGDEAIHGSNPTQGIELCTIVEYMFSLETMYKITGDPKFAEILEKVAYNALPTQIDDDFMTRQYFQQVNQVNIASVARNFDVNHSGLDNCFGILTGYPCCTSNMHQGWPKFTQNLWYATQNNGVAVTQYAPSEIDMLVGNGVKVNIIEQTTYPFGDRVDFEITDIERPTKFSFTLRVPSWSKKTNIEVNGEIIDYDIDENKLVSIDREWRQEDKLTIQFTPKVELSVWHENARAVERGPLVYALKMDAVQKKLENKYDTIYQGNWYYTLSSSTPWNYALIQRPDDKLDEFYSVVIDEKKLNSEQPWSEEGAPISIKTQALRVSNWKEYNKMAGPIPYSIMYGLETGEESTIELIPYGCTTLRITEFPMKGVHSAE